MKKDNLRWIFRITLISLAVAAVFALATNEILGTAGYVLSFTVLAAFVLIGIIFDTIAVAVTAAAAQTAPFNSMATRRERGAAESLKLLRNANRVSSFCADVIGDITGIVSGTAAALIAARMTEGFSTLTVFFPVIITASVTALTIGGKAAGKALAFSKSTQIVLGVGKTLCFLRISPYSGQEKGKKAKKSNIAQPSADKNGS